jgi:hypothetical protein
MDPRIIRRIKMSHILYLSGIDDKSFDWYNREIFESYGSTKFLCFNPYDNFFMVATLLETTVKKIQPIFVYLTVNNKITLSNANLRKNINLSEFIFVPFYGTKKVPILPETFLINLSDWLNNELNVLKTKTSINFFENLSNESSHDFYQIRDFYEKPTRENILNYLLRDDEENEYFIEADENLDYFHMNIFNGI